jgi:TonB-dependent starch-binding outer membrane protein SusC
VKLQLLGGIESFFFRTRNDKSMKKNELIRNPRSYAIKKVLLVMKLSFLLILAGTLQVSANVNGQSAVSLTLNRVEINKALSNIEKQGVYRFLYNSRLPDLQKQVSIDVNNASIGDVLAKLFLGTDLTYKTLDNNLIVVLSNTMELQDIQVTGKITGESGEALSGVSVRLKEGGRGTETDNEGNFKFTVPEKGTLIISYVGYQSQEVQVNSQSVINIKLTQSTRNLDQVVVVGYGSQRKIDVTGSVAHVKGDELIKQPVLTATQALQGKVAGVQVISSGDPGTAPQVIIRGTGSILAGANPLYIVDGIWTDDITNINTADILSVDILKDASACSIYGVRGANGVVLISTKQGSGKMKLSYTGNFGMVQAAHVVPMADAAEYINYRQQTLGLPVNATGYSTNWYDEVLRNAFYQNHALSVSGGNSQDKYAVSAGYLSTEGIIIFNNYTRYTVRMNNEFSPTSFLKIGTTASFANQAEQNVPTSTITQDAYRAAPLIPAMVNGKFGNTSQYQNVGNPVLDAQNTNDLSHNNRFQGNVWVEVKPIKSIAIRSTFNDEINFYDDRQYTYQHPNDTTFFNVNGGSQGATRSTLNVSNAKYYHWVWSNTINFNKEFGNSKINVLVGTEAQKYNNTGTSASRYSVPPIPSEWYLQSGDANYQFNGSSVIEYTTNSYLGRIFYSYNDKYLLTANFRADGSSVFAPQNRWGYFPGVSAGWIISKEDFMDHQHVFQFLKLKASWGELGNSNIAPDASVQTVLSNIPYFFNSGNTASGSTTGSIVPQIKDLNLKWEITKESDIGLEYSVLNSRLTGELDVYDKMVSNALIYVQVPGTFGSQANPNSTITPGDVLTNAATIDNKGLEFSARWHDNINKNLSYFVGANVTFNRNRVVNLNGGLPYFDGNINGYFTTETKAGYPIGSFFMRKVIGVFQNQTQIDNYKDKNGNLLQPGAQPGNFIYQFNADGQLDTAYAGSYQPKVYFGLSGGVTYKNFDFSLDIFSNIGNEVYNGKLQARVVASDNIEKSVATSYWTSANGSNSQPSPNGGNLPASTYFIASGSYVRINNITIGYTLKDKTISKQHVITGCRIFLNAQNPVTWKKFDGFSSELPGSSVTNAGIELGTYPTTRTFAGGINITF